MKPNPLEPNVDTSIQTDMECYPENMDYPEGQMNHCYEDGQMGCDDHYSYHQSMDDSYDVDTMEDPNIPTAPIAYYSGIDETFFDSVIGSTEGSTKGIQCLWKDNKNQICGCWFQTPAELINHIWIDHQEISENFVCSWSGCSRELRPIKLGSDAQAHLKKHTVYKCMTCNKNCFDSWAAGSTVSGGPFDCSKCEEEKKGHMPKEDLIALMNSIAAGTKSPPKPSQPQFKCSECLMKFKTMNNLSDHLTCHTGKKQYPCKVPGCSKIFGYQSSLAMHVDEFHCEDAATGEVIQCGWVTNGEVCNLLCLSPADLDDHIKSEHMSNIKTCGWQNCLQRGQVYRRTHNLVNHLESHTKPFWCTVCKKRYHTRDELLQHVEVHMDVEQQECFEKLDKDELYEGAADYTDSVMAYQVDSTNSVGQHTEEQLNGDNWLAPSNNTLLRHNSKSSIPYVAAHNEDCCSGLNPGSSYCSGTSKSNLGPIRHQHTHRNIHLASSSRSVSTQFNFPVSKWATKRERDPGAHQCLWVTDDEVCKKNFQKPSYLKRHIVEVHIKKTDSAFCSWQGCKLNWKPFERNDHKTIYIECMCHTTKCNQVITLNNSVKDSLDLPV